MPTTAARPVALGRYQVEGVLGTGAGGHVLLASDAWCEGRHVALKFLECQVADATAEAELQMLKVVRHESIARLEDTFMVGRQRVLVLEYLAGGDVASLVEERGQLTDFMAQDLCAQMLRAVAYLHKLGIAHRDLKPENFAFAARGGRTLKMLDFGSAAMLDERGLAVGRVGTQLYIAPEVARSHSSRAGYTEKCDMWSMGVVAHVLLTGSFPFKVRSNGGYALHFGKKFKECTPEAQDFMRRLLVEDPGARMGAEDALRHAWLRGACKCSPETPAWSA